VKILQKVLGGATFLTHTVYRALTRCLINRLIEVDLLYFR